MQTKYEWTREDLKRKLRRKRFIPNLALLSFGAFAYFFFTYYAIVWKEFDTGTVMIGFILYFTILSAALFLMTHLYVFGRLRRNDKKTSKAYGTYYIDADEMGIKSTINDSVIYYKWEDIAKFKRKKKWFFINTKKDKLGLLFSSDVMGKESYDELYSYVKKRLESKEVHCLMASKSSKASKKVSTIAHIVLITMIVVGGVSLIYSLDKLKKMEEKTTGVVTITQNT